MPNFTAPNSELPHIDNWIKSYVRYTENSEPPAIFREWCAVSVVAAALQRKTWLEWGTVTVFPNLYIVLTAPAGRARKGTAMKPAQQFLTYLGIPMSAESVTREALIQLLHNSERPIDDIGGVHSSLTVFSPELTVFLGYSNLQLLSDLTDWFDCAETWTYHTKNSGTDPIKGVFLNLLGATTPALLRSALPQDAIGGGLTSRIIFVFAEKKGKTIPFPFLSEQDKLLQQALYQEIDQIHAMKGQFKVTEDFLDAWGEWYLNNDGKNPFGLSFCRPLEGYIERRPIQLLKLSLIMSASKRRSLTVNAEDFLDALHLLTKTEKEMPNALGGIGAAQTAELTYNILAYLKKRPASLPELTQSFVYDGSSEDLGKVLGTLVNAKMVSTGIANGVTCYYISSVGENLLHSK